MDDEDELSREHHVRRRAEQVLADLRSLWGDELPPGVDPVTTVLVDSLALDDDQGRRQGLLVQGDAVPFHLLTKLMTTSTIGRDVLEELPPALRARIDLAVATVSPLTMQEWTAKRGLPQIPSGAFAMRVDPQVVDLDERVSSLLGMPARQHRVPWDELFATVHPADRGPVTEALTRAFERQGSVSMRFRVVHPDGRVYWLSSVGHALTGEDGGTEQIVGFTTPSP